MVCMRAQVRLFVFRLLCELHFEVLRSKKELGPRQRLALEYALYSLPPYTAPPSSLAEIKDVWCTFLGQRFWNRALFDYLEGLTEALVKHDPFDKPDPCWEVFCVFVNYHPTAIEKKIPGARPCSPHELGWMRALGEKDQGFDHMYEQLAYCTSIALQDFIFRLHDEAQLLVSKMQALRGTASFPDLIPNEKEPPQQDDDGWSTDARHEDPFLCETSGVQ